MSLTVDSKIINFLELNVYINPHSEISSILRCYREYATYPTFSLILYAIIFY